MKLLAFLLALGAVLGDNFLPKKISGSPEVELWKKWKELNQKEYESELEEVKRFEIWLENLEFVKDHNVAYDLGLKTYKTSVNEMADLTLDEYVASKLGAKSSKPTNFVMREQTFFDHYLIGRAPASKDWRQYGRVTPVKDQGLCGSCWSFSTTGSVEALMKNVTGKLVSLSEQELVDCDDYCYGCIGGLTKYGYQYIYLYGITSEEDYPYEGTTEVCRRGNKKNYGHVTTYMILPEGDENILEQAVGLMAPVAISIDASHRSFKFYQSGVYYEPSCGNSELDLDHAVLVVGYGTDNNGIDYWIVKNSWSARWGQQGYVWMAKSHGNNCGIATSGIFPLAI